MNAMAELNINKKKVDRFEFKFKSVTDKSLPYYLQILKVVENNLDSFNFTATFAKPQTKLWKQYLGMVERIVPDSGRFMVIADYLHQPRGQGRWQRWRIMNRLKRFCLSKAREVFSCNWRIFVSELSILG